MNKQKIQKQHRRVLQDSGQINEHFKMYKSGKMWIFASLFTISLGTSFVFGGHQDAHADAESESETTQAVINEQPASQASQIALRDNGQTVPNVTSDLKTHTPPVDDNVQETITPATSKAEDAAPKATEPQTVQTTNLGDVTDENTIAQAKRAASATYAETGTPQEITAVAGTQETADNPSTDHITNTMTSHIQVRIYPNWEKGTDPNRTNLGTDYADGGNVQLTWSVDLDLVSKTATYTLTDTKVNIPNGLDLNKPGYDMKATVLGFDQPQPRVDYWNWQYQPDDLYDRKAVINNGKINVTYQNHYPKQSGISSQPEGFIPVNVGDTLVQQGVDLTIYNTKDAIINQKSTLVPGDILVSVVYTPRWQVVHVIVEDTNANPISRDVVNGASDTELTADMVTDKVPVGYEIVTDTDPSTGITTPRITMDSTFDHDDGQDQQATIVVAAETEVLEPVTVKQTIHYQMADGTPVTGITDNVQNLTYTAIQNKVTGKVTYTPMGWLTAVTSPPVDGYAPNIGIVPINGDMITGIKPTDTTVNVTYIGNPQTFIVHYIDVNDSNKTSGWTATDGIEVLPAEQTLYGTTDETYANTITLPDNYVQVAADDGASSGIFDKDDQTDQSYNVYVKHATKTITPTTDPQNDELNATVLRTINYVYGNDTVAHRKGDQVIAPVNQQQDFTRTGIVDEVTGDVIYYSSWTPISQDDGGLTAVPSTAITGYMPDQLSIAAENVDLTGLKTGETTLKSETVTYNPDAQKIQIHYIDVTGSIKKFGWTVMDGVELTSALQTLNGTTDDVYTNPIILPTNYVKVTQDAGSASGFFDTDDKIDQNYNVYVKHATKTITPTTDPQNNQLKTTITRTINYVYGDDAVAGKRGMTATPAVVQKQDFTRTGIVDLVTNDVNYSTWTAVTSVGEGFVAVDSPTGASDTELTGYTPDKDTVVAVATSSLTASDQPVVETVTYHPDEQKVTVHYVDVNDSPKTSDWTAADGTEVSTAVQTLTGKSAGTYTNTIALPDNFVQVGTDDGASSGTFDNDSQVDQSYNVYVKHATRTITPVTDPQNGELRVTVTRTINYVYGNDTVDHQTGDKAIDSVNQHQDYSRTGTIDEVTGKITYSAWTPTIGTDEGLKMVTPTKITGYTPDQASVSSSTVDVTTLTGNETLKPVTVTYNPNPTKIAVTYVDDVENGKVVEGTSLDGFVDQTGTFNVVTPNNYELSKGQSDKVNYTFTPDNGTIAIHLSHQIGHATTITTRTINYFVQGTTMPVHASEVQPLTWHITTDKVTGATVAVPEGGYPAVNSPVVSGYTLDQTSVDNEYPGVVIGKSAGNMAVTVYYVATPDAPDNDVTPPTTPVTTPTTPETTLTTDGGTVPNEPVSETTNNGQVPTQEGSDSNGGESRTGLAGQAEQPGLTEAGEHAQPVFSQQTSNNTGKATSELPQTNEQNTRIWTSLGLGLMSIMSLLGLVKRQKREND